MTSKNVVAISQLMIFLYIRSATMINKLPLPISIKSIPSMNGKLNVPIIV